MKKNVLIFVFGLLISIALSAQSNNNERAENLAKKFVENIEKKK